MSRWLLEIIRRPRRTLAPVAFLALAPKCVVCVLAYGGIGAALGLGGPELCGAPASSPDAWASWLLMPGAALGFIALRPRRWCRDSTRSNSSRKV